MSLHVRNVSFTYDKKGPKVLRHLSFQVAEGEFCVVVGPSGTGKSTLLQLLAQLVSADAGVIEYQSDARSFGTNRGKARRALVFQYPERHFFQMTVRDELAFGLRRLGLESDEVELRIRDGLQSLGLDSAQVLCRSPFDLSAGEQRLVAIAVALVMQPQLLLLDEPTVGLDRVHREHMLAAIDEWRTKHGVTVIVVSHELAELFGRADQVIGLFDGSIIFDGRMTHFVRKPDLWQQLGLKLPPVPLLLNRLVALGLLQDDKTSDLYRTADLDAASHQMARELADFIQSLTGGEENV